ncbi:hypothetical protein O6H91_Y459500 [Diphasiastrum complanatum]|nr:hypothetical protein O6H91_Y459500 [Diphasiastrum complanatum]
MAAAAADQEFRCFVGGLSWNTTNRGLEAAFRSYGSIIEAEVIVDRDTGRPKGYGFVTFGEQRALEAAIDCMHGKDLDGRAISVSKAQPRFGGNNGSRIPPYSSGGKGASAGECFNCGRSGHWAKDCRSGADNDRYSVDRYVGTGRRGNRDHRYRSNDHNDRYRSSRYVPYDRSRGGSRVFHDDD